MSSHRDAEAFRKHMNWTTDRAPAEHWQYWFDSLSHHEQQRLAFIFSLCAENLAAKKEPA